MMGGSIGLQLKMILVRLSGINYHEWVPRRVVGDASQSFAARSALYDVGHTDGVCTRCGPSIRRYIWASKGRSLRGRRLAREKPPRMAREYSMPTLNGFPILCQLFKRNEGNDMYYS